MSPWLSNSSNGERGATAGMHGVLAIGGFPEQRDQWMNMSNRGFAEGVRRMPGGAPMLMRWALHNSNTCRGHGYGRREAAT
jgi:hypothetical protein